MIQSLQSILSFWPYLSVVILLGASTWAIWLISSLNKKEQASKNAYEANHWFLKKSAQKFRRAQF